MYDTIGVGYTDTRQADPRIAAQILQALGDAESVVNVGAGTGAYEPQDREVIPIEPSPLMIAQRPPHLARAIQGHVEDLPLPDACVDAAMASMSLHHWRDWRRGLGEMRRVARKRLVLFTYDPAYVERFWLLRDYLPELGRRDAERFPTISEQAAEAGDARVHEVPIPWDCRDGFMAAFWRRPGAYLDLRIRAGMSSFRLLSDRASLAGLGRLEADLQVGRWEEQNQELLLRSSLDLGYRLLVAERR